MTIDEAIIQVHEMKPGTLYDDDFFAKQILQLESNLSVDLSVYGEVPEHPTEYPSETPLIASGQFEEIYPMYALAKSELYSSNTAEYNNLSTVFEELYEKFKRFYAHSKTTPTMTWRGF